MDLGGAVDPEDGDFPIFAEFRRGVRLPFDFFVDFGSGFEQSFVGEDLFGVVSFEESFPGGMDVEFGGPSGCRREG